MIPKNVSCGAESPLYAIAGGCGATNGLLAAGHCRQDDQCVAVADRGVEPVEHAHVLVVEVDEFAGPYGAVMSMGTAIGSGSLLVVSEI